VSANKSEFDEFYRLEHEAQFTKRRTEREVDALVAALELRPSERVLDLGCGWGRHLYELQRRGFVDLVGVDAQEAFLEPIEGVALLERDATGLGFSAEFDAAYCAFNALFATADDAPQVLQAVSQALKPGGRFLLDTTNRERLAGAENPMRAWRGGGALPWLLEESHFDLWSGAQRITQRRLFSDGHLEERTLTRLHYTLAELVKLFSAAGLTVTDVYGDWQLGPYTAQSPRTMLVSRKDV
jgi:SAM-dependent methyltransferase